MINTFDFIIVGQGLAGTTLAHTFLEQGKTVLVIDDAQETTSSKVAAGIWNPVVFKRYTASFLAKELLLFNQDFYPKVEQKTGKSFYHPLPYYKLFSSADDVEHWRGKLNNPEVEGFLDSQINTSLNHDYIAPFGAAPINSCGFLDVKKYLNTSSEFFTQTNSFLNEEFEYNHIEFLPDGLQYKNNIAQKIIFCEGLKTLTNPYWHKLPFMPAKGEVFTIKTKLPQTQKAIVSKGIFIVPLGNDTYRVGSTYRWQDLSNTPTYDARQELIEKLDKMLAVPYDIVEHQAAVRPAAIDRRPFVGLHPENDKIGVLNGLGSRGVMLAPYFALQLAMKILHNKPLDAEVDVARVYEKK